jgi:hypothetical protein
MLSSVGSAGIIFVPDGGTVTNTGTGTATATLTCTTPAVWNYTITSGGTVASASIPSGTSASSITFTQSHTGVIPNRVGYSTTWSVSGSAGGITRNFTVSLTTTGDA